MGKISKNQTIVYVIAITVIVITFFLLGGDHWMKGMMNQGRSSYTSHLNWVQIIISMAIGFVIGLFVAKRKW
ncbi:MAG: hypothetical protein A2W99_03635 [Bacteroidetes bacterium GWF2_33_16]|nr:MAG: hypothetical protein A2X00_11435 [Bacteroidetes bacterium GWE2_32_14]OFY08276.1 MAG: hypothetical protein A2W99_03635 [Bacteroidetes bacterium GWF2_33_16]